MIISKKFFYLKNAVELWSNGAISKENLTLADLNSVYWLMMIVFDGFKTTHEKMQTQIFEQFSVLHQAIMREGERRR